MISFVFLTLSSLSAIRFSWKDDEFDDPVDLQASLDSFKKAMYDDEYLAQVNEQYYQDVTHSFGDWRPEYLAGLPEWEEQLAREHEQELVEKAERKRKLLHLAPVPSITAATSTPTEKLESATKDAKELPAKESSSKESSAKH